MKIVTRIEHYILLIEILYTPKIHNSGRVMFESQELNALSKHIFWYLLIDLITLNYLGYHKIEEILDRQKKVMA